MGLIPDFEHDIFLSYAWDDDIELPGDERWMLQFRNALQGYLRSSLSRAQKATGRSVDIFIDNRALRKDRPLDAELKQRVQSSACLLIMMSPNYLESDYCRKEREWFVERMQAGGTLSKFDRSLYPILIAHLRPTDFNGYPDVLKGSGVGYTFHRESTNDDPRLCYAGIRPGAKDYDNFNGALIDLKMALYSNFDRVLKNAPTATASPMQSQAKPAASGRIDSPAPMRPVVLLSTTPDKSRLIEAVRTRLDADGFDAVPIPTECANPENLAARAFAAVVLLGFPGHERDAAATQRVLDLARQRGLATFIGIDSSVLPLVPLFPDATYAAYKGLVAAEAPDPKWLNVETLAAGLREQIRLIEAEAPDKGSIQLVEIYIDNAREDRGVAENVARVLNGDRVQSRLRSHNIELMHYLPDESDAAKPNFNTIRRERVARSQGALVVYSQVSEDTAVSKIKDILKDTARKRQYRIAVHDGPPPKGFALLNPRVRVIKPSDDPVYLETLVEFVVDAAATIERTTRM